MCHESHFHGEKGHRSEGGPVSLPKASLKDGGGCWFTER